MNRFEEMNVAEQQEISGGSAILGPFYVNQKVIELGASIGAGIGLAVAKLLSGKQKSIKEKKNMEKLIQMTEDELCETNGGIF